MELSDITEIVSGNLKSWSPADDFTCEVIDRAADDIAYRLANHGTPSEDTVHEWIDEAVWEACDTELTYEADIVEYWGELGYPEPSEPTGEGIIPNMVRALTEYARDNIRADYEELCEALESLDSDDEAEA